jgi:inosine/xanthosine triphosphate pyrophosphatase family protein
MSILSLRASFAARHSASISAMHRLLVATKNATKPRKFPQSSATAGSWKTSRFTGGSGAGRKRRDVRCERPYQAEAASRIFDRLVLSDDSGLEVDALNGAPGVLMCAIWWLGTGTIRRIVRICFVGFRGRPQPWTARFRCCDGACEGRSDGRHG